MMTPISYRYTPSPSSIHTPMLFFTFLRLPLCSRNNKYSIHHLFLLNSSPFKKAQIAFHHCTFSFITAHSVHHCTLKQALLKTARNLSVNYAYFFNFTLLSVRIVQKEVGG